MKSGHRIGDWFLWIDIADVTVGNDRAVVVTARNAITGGDILARSFALGGMPAQFRRVADEIEKSLTALIPPDGVD